MSSEKYQVDIERCRRIGEYIADRLYGVFGKHAQTKVSKLFGKLTGLQEGS